MLHNAGPLPAIRPVMNRFAHIRHKPPEPLDTARELVVACAAMRSHVNLSHIVRTCGCFGIARVVAPIVATWLFQHLGPRDPFLAAATIMLLGTVLAFRVPDGRREPLPATG